MALAHLRRNRFSPKHLARLHRSRRPFDAPSLHAPSLEQNVAASLGTEPAPALPSARRGHTAASATVLLMGSSLLSGVLALVRIKYINVLFGAGVEQMHIARLSSCLIC